MKKSTLLYIAVIILFFACGKNEKEVQQQKIKAIQIQKAVAKKKEGKIYQEKIKVGESRKKITLNKELERIKKLLKENENNFLRSRSFI